MEDIESTGNPIPWTVRDAWAVMGVCFLSEHLIVFSWQTFDLPMVLAVLIALQAKDASWQSLGCRKFDRNAVKLAGKSVFVLYMVVGLNNAIFRYLGWQSYPQEVVRIIGGSQNLWLMSPYVVVIGPLIEEIFFRGFLFAVFRQRYGWKAAAAISSGLFAVAHLHISGLVPAFVGGCIFAYIYEKTGSIWPGIIMHCMINGVGFWAISLAKSSGS